MHFATKDYESVEVAALSDFTGDPHVREVLGWDDDSDRILNWGIEEDKKKLEASPALIRLYNQRQFGVGDPVEPAAPSARLLKRKNAGVWPRWKEPQTAVSNPYLVDKTPHTIAYV